MKRIALLVIFIGSIGILRTGFDSNFRWPWQKKIINNTITYKIPLNSNRHSYIKLIQSDLLKLDTLINPPAKTTYTVVNAANKFLYLGSGVAGAIKDADQSGTIQEECNSILREKGRTFTHPQTKKIGLFSSIQYEKYMPTGTAWITNSGDLIHRNITSVIHAVGPNCQIPKEAEIFEELLKMTYSNIFAVVIQHNNNHSQQIPISVVACPSLSTGIFKCDLEKAAIIAAETIMSIMKNTADANDPYAPTTFVMVAYDNEHFQIYKAAFDKAYNGIITPTFNDWSNKSYCIK